VGAYLPSYAIPIIVVFANTSLIIVFNVPRVSLDLGTVNDLIIRFMY
jgi:hypothetical protein